MKFEKYQALGNDFVILDCIKRDIRISPAAARTLCDRRFGIGADGVLCLLGSKKADFRMRIINSDGSEAEMCGNGIRCLARYIFEHKNSKKRELAIETLAGIIRTKTTARGGKFQSVEVNMGAPILERKKIPMKGGQNDTFAIIDACGERFLGMGVSMGNPHFVIFESRMREMDSIAHAGAVIEAHEMFPKRTNVEFARAISRKELDLIVFERGCGITGACGTGACATAVAGVVQGKLDAGVPINIHLPGGVLTVAVDEKLRAVHMAGSAEKVFEGEIEVR